MISALQNPPSGVQQRQGGIEEEVGLAGVREGLDGVENGGGELIVRCGGRHGFAG